MALISTQDHNVVVCSNGSKQCYMTKEQAKQAMRRVISSNKYREKKKGLYTLRAYECPYCHMWHIGNDKTI